MVFKGEPETRVARDADTKREYMSEKIFLKIENGIEMKRECDALPFLSLLPLNLSKTQDPFYVTIAVRTS